jgi:hypothetical protein
MSTRLGNIARPDLPRPTCRVMLVCGPPAAGKSTYVRKHAGRHDIQIDLDMIAREHGFGRDRPPSETGTLLLERNERLAALAKEPSWRIAWVILGAPSKSLREWWSEALGVKPTDLILLVPKREELHRRIKNDPDRKHVVTAHLLLVDKWLARERADNPGIIKTGCDINGYPTDPLHPWRRNAGDSNVK